jgi:hypothetical protein
MASGDTLVVFTALNNEPPSSNYATVDTRNGHVVLDFDDGPTSESAIFSGVMPQHYAGTTGVTVYLHYSMTSATGGTVDWDVYFERIGDGQLDIDSVSFAAANTVDGTTVPGTSGHIDIVSVAFTDGVDMGSVAKGEAFRIKVIRSDTPGSGGDAELHRVELRET